MTSPRRKLPRFSLRIMLIGLTICSATFAIWGKYVEPYRQQSAAINKLETMDIGGSNDPFSLVDLEMEVPQSHRWHAKLIGLILGRDKFVLIRTLRFPEGCKEDDVVFVLSRLPFLRSLALQRTPLSRRAVLCIGSLPQLEQLEAKYCDIDDFELTALEPKSSSLRQLTLTGNPITNDAVPTLVSLRNTNKLYLRWTHITRGGVEQVQQRKPDCEIYY